MTSRLARVALGAFSVLVLIGALAGPALAQEYSFTVIADSADGVNPEGCPAINDLGQVAFKARTDAGTQAILRGNGTGTFVITRDTGQYDFLGVNPSINDLGTVSFAANTSDDGEAILKGRGGPLTTIAQTEPGIFNFFGFDTSINNRGRVAFSAEIDNFDEGRFASSGGRSIPTTWLPPRRSSGPIPVPLSTIPTRSPSLISSAVTAPVSSNLRTEAS